MKKPKIIAVANQKGGVAKTTTTFNLGYELNQQGNKVLLIDMDSQANLTMGFGIDDPDELDITLYTLIMDHINNRKLPEPKDYIISQSDKDYVLDLIPSDVSLSTIELNMAGAMDRELVMKDIIDSVIEKTEYDYIIIDCLPSLGLLVINALTACDEVLITTSPDYYSAKGLELLITNILKVKKRLNTKIKIAGILITKFQKRTNIAKELDELINSTYGGMVKVYNTRIPLSVKVEEANYNQSAISQTSKNHKVAKAYKEFTQEVLNG